MDAEKEVKTITREPETFQMNYIGKPLRRVEGLEKAMGKAKYVDDLKMEGMLYAKPVFSRHAHAIVKSIDTSEAENYPGIVCIVTSKDIPGENELGEVVHDYPMLVAPGDKTRFEGDMVAIVVARTLEAAKKGAELVRVDYEVLKPVLSIDEALKDDVHVHEPSNVKHFHRVRKGDIAAGFAQSDYIFENTFEVGYQEHAYLEPQGMVAVPDIDGGITVYGSMQCPYYVQSAVARVLGFELSRVRIIQTETGGGFGGKEDVPSYIAAPAALCAYLTGKPVKLVLSREEDLRMTSKRHPIRVWLKVGVKKDGTLMAVEAKVWGDMGAHGTLSPIVLWRSNIHAAGSYRVDNVKVDVWGVYTNKVPTGAFRGFGSPQVFFAFESMMDEIASKLGVDRLEFRRKNALSPGDATVTGQILDESTGAIETLEQAEKLSDWSNLLKRVEDFNQKNRLRKKGVGIAHIHYGVSLGAMGNPLDASGAFVQIHKDGRVGVHIGGTEIGQGMKTAMAAIAAETLGQKIEMIKVYQPDTSYVPDSGPTVASRTTLFSGNAVRKACEVLRKRMVETFADFMKVEPSKVKVTNGKFSCPVGEMTFGEVAAMCDRNNVPLSETGWFASPRLSWDPGKGYGDAYLTYAFATQIVVVEVDLITGAVKVEEVYTSHDVGRAINRDAVIGQIQGGFVQGMGYALMEFIKYDEHGRMMTENFNTYIIPTIHETPRFRIGLVEKPFELGPYGAKGIGEPSLIPTPAAVANAVSHAIGKRVKRLPIIPEYLLSLITQREAEVV
ncbi:MAG: hypothetical protein PWP37_1241 [Thermotogota bacterium]|nr:hypothetical protein [Thermotogota bacterium]MDK2865049.1 hypothetical protein [Thermotogota bacterium]